MEYPFYVGKISTFYPILQAYCIKFVLFYAVQTFFVDIDGLCRIISVTINDHYKNTDSNILTIGVLFQLLLISVF